MSAAHASISAAVVGAVLVSAVLHATWNAIAHSIADKLIGFALIGVAETACAVVIVLLAAPPATASWPYLATSAVLQVGYNLLLMRCYRIGEFGQVYPLARGTSPWLVAIAAAAFAGERLSAVGLLGMAQISAGLACLVFSAGVPTRVQLPAIVAALLTGVTIAAYSTVDGLGVRHSASVAGYTGWLFLAQGPVLPLAVLALRRNRLWRDARPHLSVGLAAGALSLAAYGLVLWAQAHGALGPVAALRETSVVIGAAIGALVFNEAFGRWRVVATVLVAGGVLLLNV